MTCFGKMGTRKLAVDVSVWGSRRQRWESGGSRGNIRTKHLESHHRPIHPSYMAPGLGRDPSDSFPRENTSVNVKLKVPGTCLLTYNQSTDITELRSEPKRRQWT